MHQNNNNNQTGEHATQFIVMHRDEFQLHAEDNYGTKMYTCTHN